MKRDARLLRYARLAATAPVGVTGARDEGEAWDLLIEEALTATPLVAALGARGAVDVGSGGGSPGIPLAVATGIAVTLVEARAPKATFLRRVVAELGLDARVVHARAEELGRGDGRDAFDLALARALAPPPVAAELCLPLVRAGGHLVLWTAAVDPAPVAEAAGALGGELREVVPTGPRRQLMVVAKTAATPDRYPRRPGMAAKRPLVRLPSAP